MAHSLLFSSCSSWHRRSCYHISHSCWTSSPKLATLIMKYLGGGLCATVPEIRVTRRVPLGAPLCNQALLGVTSMLSSEPVASSSSREVETLSCPARVVPAGFMGTRGWDPFWDKWSNQPVYYCGVLSTLCTSGAHNLVLILHRIGITILGEVLAGSSTCFLALRQSPNSRFGITTKGEY